MMDHVELLEMKVDDQQTEINELKAMVNVLRDELTEIVDCVLESPYQVETLKVLNKTPAQCLANVKADAGISTVEVLARIMSREFGDSVGSFLSIYANSLRKTMITTSSESSLSEVVNKINEEL